MTPPDPPTRPPPTPLAFPPTTPGQRSPPTPPTSRPPNATARKICADHCMAKLGESLAGRDLEILEVLSRRVRMLSLDQVARTWWGSTRNATTNATRRLAVLERRGLLRRMPAMVHELPGLEEPLLTWRPGDRTPDLPAIAYRLERRWSSPLRPVALVAATREVGSWLGGGGGRKPRESELSHDLGLAALYLRFRGREPGRAASWVPEDLFDPGELEGFVPDAVVREEDRLTLIEFAGTYKKERLQKLHASCERTSLPYELW